MPKILKILTNPHESLRKKSVLVPENEINNQEIRELCDNLQETMIKKDGIGLASPQVGKNIRLVTVNTKTGPIFLFNPKITGKSWLREWGEEGCLSVPLTFGDVRRHLRITCAFCNRKGKKDKIKASGLLARVIQHEIDHLDGILFIDKAKNIKVYDEEDLESVKNDLKKRRA
jgi:peptide deformylase